MPTISPPDARASSSAFCTDCTYASHSCLLGAAAVWTAMSRYFSPTLTNPCVISAIRRAGTAVRGGPERSIFQAGLGRGKDRRICVDFREGLGARRARDLDARAGRL